MEHQNTKTAQRLAVRDLLRRAQARNQAGVRTRRMNGTRLSGRPFTGLEKVAVWLKANPIPGRDMRLWRQDPCGAYMHWNEYGNTNSQFGWEVDHIFPVARGGNDVLDNLQALHWQNNRSKADGVGVNYCAVTYRG